jgi:DUF1365 family protein
MIMDRREVTTSPLITRMIQAPCISKIITEAPVNISQVKIQIMIIRMTPSHSTNPAITTARTNLPRNMDKEIRVVATTNNVYLSAMNKCFCFYCSSPTNSSLPSSLKITLCSTPKPVFPAKYRIPMKLTCLSSNSVHQTFFFVIQV